MRINCHDDASATFGGEGKKTVSYNDEPAVLPNGQQVSALPSTVYIESDPLLYYASKISITTLCTDDESGSTRTSTRRSHVVMVIETPNTAALVTKRLFTMNAQRFQQRRQEFLLNEEENKELSEAMVPGSIVRLVLVSATGLGCHCRCRRAIIKIDWKKGRERYNVAIARDNILLHQILAKRDEGDDLSEEEHLLSFVFQESPKGVFSNIVQYAFH